MDRDSFRKDSSPEETIRLIREILHEEGIVLFERDWSSFAEVCYSVELEAEGLPELGVRGRGTSKIRALASAYAAFMERFQNLYLRIPGVEGFGLMADTKLRCIDYISLPKEQVFAECRDVLELMIEGPLEDASFSEELVCAPFLEVSSREIRLLPVEMIRLSCGSTGMCAGNTPQEALVQGLCEILERYVARKIYSGDVSFPTVPHQALRGRPAFAYIEQLERQGIKTLVKDCSFGGALPVIAAIFIAQGEGSYRWALGSDPTLDAALERCITRAFQGINGSLGAFLPLDFSFDQFKGDALLSSEECRSLHHHDFIATQSGQLPNEVFGSKGKLGINAAFDDSIYDNWSALLFMMDRIKVMGHRVFLRDVSFLGFPSYHLYVPDLTDHELFSQETFNFDMQVRAGEVKEVLLKLKGTENTKILKVAKVLEAYWSKRRQHLRVNDLFEITNVIFDGESDFGELANRDLLLSLMFRFGGDPEAAYRHLSAFLHSNADSLENIEYFHAGQALLRLLSEGVPEGQCVTYLSDIFGLDLAEEVTKDLSDPFDTFEYYALPNCGDCSRCPEIQHCKFEQWWRFSDVARRRMVEHPIDQQELANII